MRSTFPTLVVALSLGLVGCGDSAPPPPPAAAVAKPKPKVVAAPVNAEAEVARQSYTYNPLGKRDPFRGSVADRANNDTGPRSDSQECQEALCQYDVDDLSLVAVVSGDANPLAMVEDKAGVGYLVRRNTKMGKQGGKVTAIQRDCIQVTSYLPTLNGPMQPNRVDLCVRVDQKMRDPLDLSKNKVD